MALRSSISLLVAAAFVVERVVAVVADLVLALEGPEFPAVSFSRALVLACTGLLSPMSLDGEAASSPLSAAFPPPISAEGRRTDVVLPVMDSLPLVGLVVVGLADAEDVEGCRARVVGIGGGPMDVRELPAPGRVFAPTADVRVLEGVVVRDGAVLDVADPSCFVGDLVGDCARIPCYPLPFFALNRRGHLL